ncbi:large ribosomal subunit protein bL35m [Phymastichus coffea]|uniref:large ribosomal subunit protein bL35m n=1 Tax=Phymastichus coffea TaxID=108790 RepID=UPI00273B730C|nr:large ribosomal subunit protein bL35m [Phymastichus coffea]
MFRAVTTALREGAKKAFAVSALVYGNVTSTLLSPQARSLSVFAKQLECQTTLKVENKGTKNLSNSINKLLVLQTQFSAVPCRTVTKFSLKKGKRKSVKTVLYRFYRLNWGIWIRTKAGRQKHLWKKSASRRRKLKQHVFTNSTQSWMLDKMVTAFWRRPKYWVDDPYEPYHKREEFPFTQKKPRPLPE